MATVRKLIVEVVDARNLSPKDGHGTSSPYVVMDYYGQRKRTQTKIRDLNPVWNELLEFNVGKPSDVFGDVLELDVHHDKNYGPTRRNNFLGRIRLSSTQFVKKGEEALIYFPLEKKSFFSWIQGEIGLKIYYVDEVVPPPAPPTPPPQAEEPKAETAPPPSSEAPPPPESDSTPPPGEKETKADPPPEAEQAPPPEGEKPAEEPPTEVVPPQETVAPEDVQSDPPPGRRQHHHHPLMMQIMIKGIRRRRHHLKQPCNVNPK
ncbi:hypothetical protein ACFXTN_012431 [Malus domestica]